jgi:protein-disulfide isomerase
MSLKPPVSNKDHIQGTTDAIIELVEYGDFQCAYCGEAYPIIKSIQQQFGDDLKFVFRNFPLSKIHRHAKLAAVASEAADRQGKYWEMYDMLFVNQTELHRSALTAYAKTIDLDFVQFENDLDDSLLFEKVEADFESGLRNGVNKTPSFFINGIIYDGNWEETSLSFYIKRMIDLMVR